MAATKRKLPLTPTEQRTLARMYAGGIEALRTPDFTATTATINALFRKQLLDKNGFTSKGRAIAKALADAGVF